MSKSSDRTLKELRSWGLTLPGAHLKSPWPGHLDLAVKDKTFAYLSLEGEPFGLSCKLPQSGEQVRMTVPNATPTEYGLGKSGWVSVKFDGDDLPVELIRGWIMESYRAQAPKKLLAQLEGGAAPAKAPAKKKKAPANAPAKVPAKKARARG